MFPDLAAARLFIEASGEPCVELDGRAECATIAAYDLFLENAETDADLAFSDISDGLGDAALDYFHYLLRFGDYSLPEPETAELSEIDPIDADLSELSLTF